MLTILLFLSVTLLSQSQVLAQQSLRCEEILRAPFVSGETSVHPDRSSVGFSDDSFLVSRMIQEEVLLSENTQNPLVENWLFSLRAAPALYQYGLEFPSEEVEKRWRALAPRGDFG